MPNAVMNANMSSMLANGLIAYPKWRKADDFIDPCTVDLASIREQPMPPNYGDVYRDREGYDSEAEWQLHLNNEVAQSVFYLWSFFEFIHLLGSVEHTNDWDWWIRVTLTDGEEIYCDCGSEFMGMIKADGSFHPSPQLLEAVWPHDHSSPQLTALAINAYLWRQTKDGHDDYDQDTYEEELRFDLDLISSITIGYDT